MITRKLFRSGHSVVISIPPGILEAAGMREGDPVELRVSRQALVVTLPGHGGGGAARREVESVLGEEAAE